MRIVERIRDALAQAHKQYENGEERPLRGYVAAMGVYGGFVGSLAVFGRAAGVRLPDRFSAGDTVLVGIATHKASRLLAKDAVTSPLRAPFARYEEPAGDGEVNESVRGHGVQHAVGELLTCPFCLAMWVATGLTAGMVFAPRIARTAATVLTAVAVSDALQLAYDSAKQAAG